MTPQQTLASSGGESKPSVFVTAVAWIFIVLAGFAALISLLQNIMISVMLFDPEIGPILRGAQNAEEVPYSAWPRWYRRSGS